MDKVIYSGHTLDQDGNEIRYYTDDKDCLPPDLINFSQTQYLGFHWVDFMREAFRGEQQGFRYNIQLGDLFYETLEEA